MDELKAMTTAILESLIEMTKRAVTAENLETALYANIDKARDDANYWKDAYHRVDKRLEAALAELEALKNDSEGN